MTYKKEYKVIKSFTVNVNGKLEDINVGEIIKNSIEEERSFRLERLSGYTFSESFLSSNFDYVHLQVDEANKQYTLTLDSKLWIIYNIDMPNVFIVHNDKAGVIYTLALDEVLNKWSLLREHLYFTSKVNTETFYVRLKDHDLIRYDHFIMFIDWITSRLKLNIFDYNNGNRIF